METRLNDAFPPVDESFERSMDRAFEAIRKEEHAVKRKMSVGLILAAALMLLSATALAVSALHYSPRQDVRNQAHAALNEKYGMTEELIALFDETIAENDSGWTVEYALPAYGEQAGTYLVTRTGGKVDASWSHDGEAFDESGNLDSAVWGVPQLERMRRIYEAHAEAVARCDELGGYDALSIEEKAAVDAPLLELPHAVIMIHIAPEEGDLQPDEAEALARDEILRRCPDDEAALSECECGVSFMLADEGREYKLLFCADGCVRYDVRLLSPSGAILHCGRFSESDGDAVDVSEIVIGEEFMSVEERAALHEARRRAGGDPERWIAVLPEAGDVSESEAVEIARAALQERFGVSAETLSAMQREVYCEIDSWTFEEPTRSWFIRFVDSVDDYQVRICAADGTVANVSNQGNVLGAG